MLGVQGVEEMLGETQENGDGHQIRSWVPTVVRPGVAPAAGPAGENFQDLPEGLGAQKGVPLRSSPQGHQGEEPVEAKLLRRELPMVPGGQQEGAEYASEGGPLRLVSGGTGEPEKVSEHQQDQTGFRRGSSGVPQGKV